MVCWRIPVGDWSDRAAWLRVRLQLPLALGYLWFAQPTVQSLVVTATLIVLGLLIRGWAAGHLKKYQGITVTGPYAWVRHPLYLGTAVLLVALAVAARNPWLAGLIAVYFIAFFVPTFRREERFQLAESNDFYEFYRAVVPALIPGLRPRRFRQAAAGGSPKFSFGTYLHNKEWRASVAAAAMLGLLYAKIVLL